MPTLNWIGKEAMVNYHHKVPFHLLKNVPELSVGDPGSGNPAGRDVTGGGVSQNGVQCGQSEARRTCSDGE